MKIEIDTSKIFLSGKIRVFKTEQFIKKTKNLFGIDNLISYIGDGIIHNLDSIVKKSTDTLDCFLVRLIGENSLFKLEIMFKFAKDINSQTMNFNPMDIIFFHYENESNTELKRDTRVLDFLSKNNTFSVEIERQKKVLSNKEFLKIYLLSSDNGVNFPLLNKEQQALIEIENENVLVQGVAGSGKTNICLNKLVNTALREYGGRVLYSTYSKSLLLDIKNKLEIFKQNIHRLNANLKANKVVFTDNQHIRAIENKLGIWLDLNDSKDITTKLDKMESFIETHIDLFLIEDLAEKFNQKKPSENMVDEKFFVKQYVPNIKNYQLASKFEKIKYLSYEIIYKEIYGNIFGSVSDIKKSNMLTLQQYKELRKNSFSSFECEIIYSISQDYHNFLIKNNYVDNNILTQRLIKTNIEKYSLVVLDEVQDFTQINLRLFKNISRRMFCVGDALQMINPSYFSFALLKNMMFEKDISNVKQLTNNYRNSKKIEKIVEGLNKINTKQFGVHNFVLTSQSIDSEVTSQTYYLNSENYLKFIKENKLVNLTFVCSNNEEKERLKRIIPNNEVLTISEIKGLERNSVVLCDILSSNFEKWKSLERNTINRKT
ncbi:MAG: UvrD-helicase domain-containing protein, partial [Clostridia bacterium]|nr:UvrD-helicase domain-containing protein [Clostridia bacterium]